MGTNAQVIIILHSNYIIYFIFYFLFLFNFYFNKINLLIFNLIKIKYFKYSIAMLNVIDLLVHLKMVQSKYGMLKLERY